MECCFLFFCFFCFYCNGFSGIGCCLYGVVYLLHKIRNSSREGVFGVTFIIVIATVSWTYFQWNFEIVLSNVQTPQSMRPSSSVVIVTWMSCECCCDSSHYIFGFSDSCCKTSVGCLRVSPMPDKIALYPPELLRIIIFGKVIWMSSRWFKNPVSRHMWCSLLKLVLP